MVLFEYQATSGSNLIDLGDPNQMTIVIQEMQVGIQTNHRKMQVTFCIS